LLCQAWRHGFLALLAAWAAWCWHPLVAAVFRIPVQIALRQGLATVLAQC
jgi:hypothetical protein